MYAVVSSGGKQYRVEPGSTLTMERLAADAGASVTFDRVLLVGDGDSVTVGTPTVSGATVSATVLGEELGPKIIIFKFKQKVKYRRRTGHRQHLVRVRIDGITANGKTTAAEEPATAPKAAKARAPRTSSASTAKAAPRATKRPAKPAAKRAAKPAAEATALEEESTPARRRTPTKTTKTTKSTAKSEPKE